MKPPPRLRLEPRPSRLACALVVASCTFAMLELALLPLPLAGRVAGAVGVAAFFVAGLWRCAGRGVPALLHVGIDRRITVTDRDGRSRDGTILDASYAGARITTIVWRADRQPWWRPARTILVLPDSLAGEHFRQLRVALRYGRPRAPPDANEVEDD